MGLEFKANENKEQSLLSQVESKEAENAQAVQPEQESQAAEAQSADAVAPVPENAEPAISQENATKLAQIASELHWLVSEGYVVEYSDSSLQANPYLPKPKNKAENADEAAQQLGEKDEPLPSQAASEQPEQEADNAPEQNGESSVTSEN